MMSPGLTEAGCYAQRYQELDLNLICDVENKNEKNENINAVFSGLFVKFDDYR